MQVGVMEEVRAPGMEHGEKADLGAQVFGISADDEQGLRGGPERMFEKSQADARRLRIRRVAAMSISVSEVCTLYS